MSLPRIIHFQIWSQDLGLGGPYNCMNINKDLLHTALRAFRLDISPMTKLDTRYLYMYYVSDSTSFLRQGYPRVLWDYSQNYSHSFAEATPLAGKFYDQVAYFVSLLTNRAFSRALAYLIGLVNEISPQLVGRFVIRSTQNYMHNYYIDEGHLCSKSDPGLLVNAMSIVAFLELDHPVGHFCADVVRRVQPRLRRYK